MIENKVLIITSLLPKELTRLYGLVSKSEVKEDAYKDKIFKFYEDKKELISNFNNYDNLYKYFKTIKDKYKNKVIFLNQEVDNKFVEYNIEALNLQGSLFNYYCDDCNLKNSSTTCSKCGKENLFYNITFKEDKRQYSQVVDLINETQNLIFIGNISDLDPTLYTEDFVDTLYVNTEEIQYKGQNPYISKEDREKNFSDFFNQKLIIEDLNNSIDIIDNFIKEKLSKKNVININNPYKDNGEEIIKLINVFFDNVKLKNNIKNLHYDKRIVKALKNTYPFVKKVPELYIHNIWFAFCYDTKRNPSIIKYDYLFYDMLLVYSKFKWEGVKKYFTKHPKVSLTIAYNENDEKTINLFKKLLFKDENSIQY